MPLARSRPSRVTLAPARTKWRLRCAQSMVVPPGPLSAPAPRMIAWFAVTTMPQLLEPVRYLRGAGRGRQPARSCDASHLFRMKKTNIRAQGWTLHGCMAARSNNTARFAPCRQLEHAAVVERGDGGGKGAGAAGRRQDGDAAHKPLLAWMVVGHEPCTRERDIKLSVCTLLKLSLA